MSTDRNIMSVDLESWVHLIPEFQNLDSVERKKIDNEDIVRESEYLLNELSKRSIKLTWYVVSEIAEWYPDLIESLIKEGHEIGYHTNSHKHIYNHETLLSELHKSSEFIKQYRPTTFQAPSIVFCEEGYKYLKQFGITSSLSVYGETNNLFFKDGVLECPVSLFTYRNFNGRLEYPSNMNLRLLTYGIPFGSSLWYSLGYKFISFFIERSRDTQQFVNMFIHNWQIFPPTQKAQIAKRKLCIKNPAFVFYLPNVREMFLTLMDNFKWERTSDVLKSHLEIL